jgi:hypothetical protein
MNLNFFLSIILIVMALFYIKYTEIFFRFCYTYGVLKDSHPDRDILNEKFGTTFHLDGLNVTNSKNFNSIKLQNLENLCKESMIDYNSHYLMSISLERLNEVILSKDILDPETFHNYLSNIDIINVKLSLLVLKLIYIAIYLTIVYLLIVMIPNFVIQICLSLFNKLLMFMFIILLVESVLKIYFQINIDLVSWLNKSLYLQYADYFPMDYILRLFRFIAELINKIL